MTPYFTDGTVTIYHGDCREILPTLEYDCVVTDPPYGVDLGSHAGATEKRAGYLIKQGYDSYDDTLENLRSVVVPAIALALTRAKRGAVWCAGSRIREFPEASCVGGVFMPSGVGRNAWGFTNMAFVLLYGSAPGLENGAHHTAIRSTATAEKNGHPCPKPLAWMTWLVGLAVAAGETVVDPFMGSGTTLRAAKDLGRKAIGIEIDEKYCEIAARRMSQQTLAL